MGNDAAGSNHHGFLHRAVLRRRDIPLILRLGAAGLRRVAAMTSGGSGGRNGCGDESGGKGCGNNAGHEIPAGLRKLAGRTKPRLARMFSAIGRAST
jgi:hypothetical protein